MSLEDDHDQRHHWLDEAELQSSLLAEPQSSDVVAAAIETTSAVEVAGLDWSASDLRHDVTFTTEILVAETQEVVDDEGLVAVPHRVEVDIVVVVGEEEEGEPGGEGVEGDNEENPHDPSLFSRVGVEPVT